MRGLAEQAESTESERFKEPTGPLLSAREVSPRTKLPADETLEQRDKGVYCSSPSQVRAGVGHFLRLKITRGVIGNREAA